MTKMRILLETVAMKLAVMNFTRAYGQKNAKVNTIFPRRFPTQFTKNSFIKNLSALLTGP